MIVPERHIHRDIVLRAMRPMSVNGGAGIQ